MKVFQLVAKQQVGVTVTHLSLMINKDSFLSVANIVNIRTGPVKVNIYLVMITCSFSYSVYVNIQSILLALPLFNFIDD